LSVFAVTAVVGQLTKVLTKIRQEICLRVKKPLSADGEKLTSKLNNLIKDHLSEFSSSSPYNFNVITV